MRRNPIDFQSLIRTQTFLKICDESSQPVNMELGKCGEMIIFVENVGVKLSLIG